MTDETNKKEIKSGWKRDKILDYIKKGVIIMAGIGALYQCIKYENKSKEENPIQDHWAYRKATTLKDSISNAYKIQEDNLKTIASKYDSLASIYLDSTSTGIDTVKFYSETNQEDNIIIKDYKEDSTEIKSLIAFSGIDSKSKKDLAKFLEEHNYGHYVEFWKPSTLEQKAWTFDKIASTTYGTQVDSKVDSNGTRYEMENQNPSENSQSKNSNSKTKELTEAEKEATRKKFIADNTPKGKNGAQENKNNSNQNKYQHEFDSMRNAWSEKADKEYELAKQKKEDSIRNAYETQAKTDSLNNISKNDLESKLTLTEIRNNLIEIETQEDWDSVMYLKEKKLHQTWWDNTQSENKGKKLPTEANFFDGETIYVQVGEENGIFGFTSKNYTEETIAEKDECGVITKKKIKGTFPTIKPEIFYEALNNSQ